MFNLGYDVFDRAVAKAQTIHCGFCAKGATVMATAGGLDKAFVYIAVAF